MILAAGQGKRLRPLTDSCPKPLLPLRDKCLIEYQIAALASAGVKQLVINTAYLAEQFPEKLGDGRRYGVHIQYTREPEGRYETGGGIINALPLLGAEPFLVVSGDIQTDFPYASLRDIQLSPNHLAHLILVDNPDYHPAGDFYLDPLQKIAHKPCHPNGMKKTFANIGLYHPALFKGHTLGFIKLSHLLHEPIAKGQVTGAYFTGKWVNITYPSHWEELLKSPLF